MEPGGRLRRYAGRSALAMCLLCPLLFAWITATHLYVATAGERVAATVTREGGGGSAWQVRPEGGEEVVDLTWMPAGVAAGDVVEVLLPTSPWLQPQHTAEPWYVGWPFLAFTLVPLAVWCATSTTTPDGRRAP